jgi:hypothetical protein
VVFQVLWGKTNRWEGRKIGLTLTKVSDDTLTTQVWPVTSGEMDRGCGAMASPPPYPKTPEFLMGGLYLKHEG